MSYSDYNNNGPKKNKSSMVQKNNSSIMRREKDDHLIQKSMGRNKLDVDRLMLERSMTSHGRDNDDNDDNDQSSQDDDGFVGNITGERINNDDMYDKGMPLRSSFTIKKSKYDNNAHLDFNLYDKVNKKENKKVESNDLYSGDYAHIDEAMKTITRGVDPYETCIADLNTMTCWLYNNMYMISKGGYIVNGFGVFSGFGTLYLIGKGNVELEMKNYFGFAEKKHLNAGLLTLKDEIHNLRDQIVIDNYLINDHFITTNKEMGKKLKRLIFNVVVNKSLPEEEEKRVNHIIKTMSGISDIVSANTLLNVEVSLMCVSRISPIWGYQVDDVVKGRFYDNNNNGEMINYIRFLGKSFNHFQDPDIMMIEVPTIADELVIGFVLRKDGRKNVATDNDKLNMAINYLKPVVMDEVMIPMIQKRYKTRLINILKKTGLKASFIEDNEFPQLYPEGSSRLGDVLQYVDIIFDDRCSNKKSSNRGYKTSSKFICSYEFEYYVRLTSGPILMMGRY